MKEKVWLEKWTALSSSISRYIDTQWHAHFSPLRSKLGSTRWVLGEDRVTQETVLCLSRPSRKTRTMRCQLQAGVLKSILMMKMTTRGVKILQSLRQDGQNLSCLLRMKCIWQHFDQLDPWKSTRHAMMSQHGFVYLLQKNLWWPPLYLSMENQNFN